MAGGLEPGDPARRSPRVGQMGALRPRGPDRGRPPDTRDRRHRSSPRQGPRAPLPRRINELVAAAGAARYARAHGARRRLHQHPRGGGGARRGAPPPNTPPPPPPPPPPTPPPAPPGPARPRPPRAPRLGPFSW